MLCRFSHIPRCLPRTYRQCLKAYSPFRLSYSSIAPQDLARNYQPLPLEPVTLTQAPENFHRAASAKTREDSEKDRKDEVGFSELLPKKTRRVPRSIFNPRARLLRKEGTRKVRLRFVQKKFEATRSPRPKPRFIKVYARPNVEAPWCPPKRRPRTTAEQNYLIFPRRVSLEQWAKCPQTEVTESSPQSIEHSFDEAVTHATPAESESREAEPSINELVIQEPARLFRTHVAGSSLDELVTSWSTRIMCLEEGRPLEHFRTIRIERFMRKYASIHISRKTLHQLWNHLPAKHRLDRWQDAILWCIQNSPKRALILLLATFKGSIFKPPRYMVEDCLRLLARRFLLDDVAPDPLALNAIWRLTIRFVEVASAKGSVSHTISQDVVQLLLKHCQGPQALSLYENLISNQTSLNVNTLLHFLEHFIDSGNLEASVNVFEKIANNCPAWFLSTEAIQMACVKIIRTRWGSERTYEIQSRILLRILEIGIRPTTQMYNAILLTMIEGHDFDTAWEMFGVAEQSSKFRINSITYSILAKGASLSGNTSMLQKLLDDVKETPELQNERLLSDLLGAVGALSPDDEYPQMLAFYQQYFDIRPLHDLGLCILESEGQQSFEAGGKWPTKYILGRMILAYNKSHTSSHRLIQNYNTYHNFAQEEHPLIAPLARDDYVANSFVLAFGQKVETLPYCTTVIKHMLSPPPDSPRYATPSVQTWSILLAAYMRHRQKFAAEKVFAMMQDRGLKPDQVTWTTLIGGYSSMQDIDSAVGAVRQMEAAGFEPNSRTWKALDRIWDQSRLLSVLKESIDDDLASEATASDESGTEILEWEKDEGFQKNKAKEIREYMSSYSQKYV
ncbi:hypothetical protein ACLMJK_007279 [Lecanora helva]